MCGRKFHIRGTERDICSSPRCYYRRLHPVTERKCPECGRRHRRPHMGTEFCSNRCAMRVVKREARARRRARVKRRSTGEPIYMDWVFVRDDGICGICRNPVDRSLPARSLWSATIDHIVPLSKGGIHAPENVQLAHLVCNSVKRDLTKGWRKGERTDSISVPAVATAAFAEVAA